MKKYILLPALVLWICATPAYAITVTCTNCSTNLIQLLDRITNVEQLTNTIKQYQEAVEQTRQQITMVQQNIEQYQNMLQNTAQLPANLVNELKGSLTRLANLSSTLRTQRGARNGTSGRNPLTRPRRLPFSFPASNWRTCSAIRRVFNNT